MIQLFQGRKTDMKGFAYWNKKDLQEVSEKKVKAQPYAQDFTFCMKRNRPYGDLLIGAKNLCIHTQVIITSRVCSYE